MFGGYDPYDDNNDYFFDEPSPHVDQPIIHKKPKSPMKHEHVKKPKPPSNFPLEYLLKKISYPAPAVPFEEHPTVGDFTKLKIYVSKDYFKMTMRDLFVNIDIKHRKEDAYRWIKGPDLSFWPQMLNFVLWCSTAGCGVAVNMMKDTQIGSFFRFHVAFTMRRLLYELKATLPGDRVFNSVSISYDKVALERIRNEFRPPTKDFRFTHGSNGGIGDIYVDGKKTHTDWGHEPTEKEKAFDKRMNIWPGGTHKFGGTPPHLPMDYLYNPQSKFQWKYFIPQEGKGLTAAGLARINRSIEAFVYCILGAQVNTRSPIMGASGASQEAQREFLTLFESAVIENDISKSVQRYQLAVQQSKVRLDYAISPGCWLMPSNLIINTHSVVGYNNKLQRATKDMKFGVNDINSETTAAVPHVVTKKVHIDKPPPHVAPKTLPIVKKPTPPVIPEEDHTLLKAGLTVASVAMGYYIWR